MKTIKVFMGGQRMRDIYPHATRWQVIKYKVAMFLRKVMIVILTLAGIAVTFAAGSYLMPTVVAQEVVKEVPQPLEIPPVLTRIAKCESATGHYDERGQVRVVGNSDGSVDIGKYQINEAIWGKKATELKLNLFNEHDNETMAIWLYQNRGTEDWYLSKHCWKK